MGFGDKYVEGFIASKIVNQLTRIADALEAQNFEALELWKARKDYKETSSSPKIEPIEVTEQEIVDEELEKSREVAEELFNSNDSKSVWPEDNIPLELQEEIE